MGIFGGVSKKGGSRSGEKRQSKGGGEGTHEVLKKAVRVKIPLTPREGNRGNGGSV